MHTTDIGTDTETAAALGRMSRNRPVTRSRTAALTAGLAGLGLLLAACGGTSSAATGGSSTATTVAGSATATTTPGNNATGTGGNGANRAALTAYRACLTQHGVTLPTRPTTTTVAGQAPDTGPGGPGRGGFGGGGGGGLQAAVADPANKAAVDACQSLLPPGGLGAGNAARRQASQAYYSCLSDNGVTVPTTTASGPPPSIDRTSAAFTAANQKCQALLPQRSTSTTTADTSTATTSIATTSIATTSIATTSIATAVTG